MTRMALRRAQRVPGRLPGVVHATYFQQGLPSLPGMDSEPDECKLPNNVGKALKACESAITRLSFTSAQATIIKERLEQLAAEISIDDTPPSDEKSAKSDATGVNGFAFLNPIRIQGSSSSVIFTLIVHSACIASNLMLQYAAPIPTYTPNVLSLSLCGMHVALLTRLVGPSNSTVMITIGKLQLRWWAPGNAKCHIFQVMQTVLTLVHYFGCGVIAFTRMELKYVCDDCSSDAHPEYWSFIDALYFCVVLFSTVGCKPS